VVSFGNSKVRPSCSKNDSITSIGLPFYYTMQDKLFALVKSMTPAEKAYLGKYSRLNSVREKPDYLLLFEFLEELEEYDEAAIRERFAAEKFISQLARKKTQLKAKIMESLSVYHAQRTTESTLRLQMNLLPVLYQKATKDKTLIREYESLVKTIRQKAEADECLSVLVDLFTWERRAQILQDTNKHDDKVIGVLEARESAQAIRDEELKMESAAIRTQLIILKDPKIKKAENRQKFEQTVVGLLKDVQPEKLSTKAKRDFYYTQSAYYGYLGQWDAAHTAAKCLIETYPETQTQISKDDKRNLCRYLVVADYADNYERYLAVIETLKAVSFEEDMGIFNTIHFKMLIYYLNKRQFEDAIQISDRVEDKWEVLCTVVEKRRQLAYCYNMAVGYWFGGKIKSALYCLSKIFNSENVVQGLRFVYAARIIQLPIYHDFEDENLDNRIESTRKVLTKKGELNQYRQIILAGFRKLIRCANKREESVCLTKLHNDLSAIKTAQKINEMDLECLLLWCERNIKPTRTSDS